MTTPTRSPGLPYLPPRVPTGLATASVVMAIVWGVVQVLSTLAGDTSSLLSNAVSTATWIVTCLWLTQARDVARSYAHQVPQRRGNFSVWVGWWVPIINFWFPYRVVRDLQRAAAAAEPADRPRRVGGTGNSVAGWFAAWVTYQAIGWLIIPIAIAAGLDTAEAGAVARLLGLATLPFYLGALVLWVRLVRSIDDALVSAEHDLHRRRTRTASAASAR